MKPIRLILSAFGPYAEKETIDFRLLAERSFFLIHGPTGAGKSTILDAIAFALYGETSGGERQATQMRSGHASPDLPTEVVLDFALGSEIYRVARSPEQERPRKRGEGTTVQRPAATLWKRTGLVEDAEEGVPLAGQWNRVTEEIQRLLGFQSDQFRQVVMLPQGQFRRFLISDSKGREEILEVLFQTEIFKRIQDALKEEARRLKIRVEDLGNRQKILLQQASVASEGELVEYRTALSSRLSEIAGRLEALEAREKEAGERLVKAREEAAKIEEWKSAERAAAAVEGKTGEIRADTARLDRARKAIGLEDVEAHLLSRERELQIASTGCTGAEKALAVAVQSKEASGRALAVEEGREGEREEARRGLDRLKEMVSGVRELRLARETLDKSSHRAVRISGLLEGRKSDLQGRRTRLEEGRVQLATLEEAGKTIERHRLECARVGRLHARAAVLSEKRSELARAGKSAEASGENFQRVTRELAKARESADTLEKAWFEGQAAILALSLEAGAPCPVCGSPDHPAPAHSRGDLPDAAAVRKARKNVQDLEKQADGKRREHDANQAAALTLATEVKGLEKNLVEEGCDDPNNLEKTLVETRRLLKAAEDAQKKAGTLGKRLATLTAEESALGLRCERLAQGLREAEARVSAHEAVVRERSGRVPDGLREPSALERAIADGESRLKKLTSALELARKKHESSAGAVAACEGKLQAARSAEHSARESLREAKERFAARLSTSGFADTGDYASAKLDSRAVEKLDAKIRAFQVELGAAGERLLRARSAAEGLPAPDLPALEKQAEEMRAAHTAAVAEKASLSEKITQADLRLRDLLGISRQMEEEERRHGVAAMLSDAANGQNPQRVSFQRFVLASFLDDVLDAASKRLRRMSKGRYDLERAKEAGSLRSAGGLDLLVFDAYTGMARPVNTLSGGESFLASLALALGLVDVVQAHAGGMKLETVFVDEGFGSLDPEALDLAFETLLDLQQGHRLVGVISHVPELKERVDARLEIISGKRGSTSRFVV